MTAAGRDDGFQSAPGHKPTFHFNPNGTSRFHHRSENTVDHIFRENPEISKRIQIHFQRLCFQAQSVRLVTNDNCPKIRQARFGANRREFRKPQLNRVAGVLVFPTLNFRERRANSRSSMTLCVTAFCHLIWRCGPDLNRRIEVLQTSPLGRLGTAPCGARHHSRNFRLL